MANLINEAEIRSTWSPIIESATGITESGKLAWMSQYCHNHKLYEDANIMSLGDAGNIFGMGGAKLPSGMGVGGSSVSTADGSGDKSPSLLPLAMQVAGQTIGLDLVPVVPMAGPMGLLSYLDFVYEGGKIGGSEAPTYVKASGAGSANIAAAGGTNGDYTYIGSSRIDGKSIFKVGTLDGGSATVAADLEAYGADAGSVELVKALEDHIPGMSGNDNGSAFERGIGEQTPDKLMGLSLFSKSVAAETFQIAAAVTREQVQDLKQFGVDAVAQVESVLVNELTQSINKLILSKISALGTTNVTNALSAGGLDVTLQAASALSGGETVASEQRKILTNILAGANLIANRGRRGAGNFAVVGPQIATVLQSIAGFVANPMANTFAQSAGAIYPIGAVAGVNVYTDPNRAWNDYFVSVGRKGDGNSAGIVFMPYLMAESVQAIAEGTMAPKVAVKSRFALVEAGFHPETQYAKFEVKGTWTNIIDLS
jgi:hypothetical protein